MRHLVSLGKVSWPWNNQSSLSLLKILWTHNHLQPMSCSPLCQCLKLIKYTKTKIQWSLCKLNKTESCINWTLNKVPLQEIFVQFPCINWTPVYSLSLYYHSAQVDYNWNPYRYSFNIRFTDSLYDDVESRPIWYIAMHHSVMGKLFCRLKGHQIWC